MFPMPPDFLAYFNYGNSKNLFAQQLFLFSRQFFRTVSTNNLNRKENSKAFVL
jgi:hypothetical protein